MEPSDHGSDQVVDREMPMNSPGSGGIRRRRLNTSASSPTSIEKRFLLDDLPPILTVREVARIIRRSESGTYAWLRAGGLKHLRIEGTVRIVKADLENFLAGRSVHGGDCDRSRPNAAIEGEVTPGGRSSH